MAICNSHIRLSDRMSAVAKSSARRSTLSTISRMAKFHNGHTDQKDTKIIQIVDNEGVQDVSQIFGTNSRAKNKKFVGFAQISGRSMAGQRC